MLRVDASVFASSRPHELCEAYYDAQSHSHDPASRSLARSSLSYLLLSHCSSNSNASGTTTPLRRHAPADRQRARDNRATRTRSPSSSWSCGSSWPSNLVLDCHKCTFTLCRERDPCRTLSHSTRSIQIHSMLSSFADHRKHLEVVSHIKQTLTHSLDRAALVLRTLVLSYSQHPAASIGDRPQRACIASRSRSRDRSAHERRARASHSRIRLLEHTPSSTSTTSTLQAHACHPCDYQRDHDS